MIRVLIIPEDSKLDQYILKPIVKRIFDDLRQSAFITVYQPRLRSVDKALDNEIIDTIIQQHDMADLFLLMIDRDGNRTNNEERAKAREAEHPDKLFACLAKEEVEVWMLGLYRNELPARWSEVRLEEDPKERFALPFLATMGWDNRGLVGGGRKKAMRALNSSKWRGLLEVCEELAELKQRIAEWLENR